MSQDEFELDETDRGILQLLQYDARNNTATEIAERVGVSDTTVNTRIAALEERGVIRGYTVLLDYEETGVNPKVRLVCTAPATEREALAREAIDVDTVVDVRTVLSGERNVVVTIVGRDLAELSQAIRELEATGLTVVDSGIVRSELHTPFGDFGTDAVDEA